MRTEEQSRCDSNILTLSFVMAHYRASESKREQFRRYLEKAGVLDSLTNVLVALYEETEKPNNALDFIKHHLGVAGPESDDAESLRLELNDLQQKCQQLVEENKELKTRLMQYEPAQEDGTE
ncbi:C-Myc-binding protein isoform X1 [Misgurnus anguillicaudatus]|uniref:C-Myc-binding protein isoform X1 n=1 Tax=Misgurnus anguillicaudatus TaxID=75329 RepID=UPI003CCF95B4